MGLWGLAHKQPGELEPAGIPGKELLLNCRVYGTVIDACIR
jgi:hypothetical protein